MRLQRLPEVAADNYVLLENSRLECYLMNKLKDIGYALDNTDYISL